MILSTQFPIANGLVLHKVFQKKGGLTIVENDKNELIPTWTVTGWKVCIDYQKLNDAMKKDHFPLSFIDQMLDRLAGKEYYCFSMDTLDVIRFQYIQMTKKRLHLHVLLAHMLLNRCHLDYIVTPQKSSL